MVDDVGFAADLALCLVPDQLVRGVRVPKTPTAIEVKMVQPLVHTASIGAAINEFVPTIMAVPIATVRATGESVRELRKRKKEGKEIDKEREREREREREGGGEKERCARVDCVVCVLAPHSDIHFQSNTVLGLIARSHTRGIAGLA